MINFKSLTRNKDFKEVYNKGNSVVDRFLVLYILPNNRQENRFGLSVGKKVGKAVTRNRYKRILRELCRINIDRIENGYDCVIIARPRVLEADYKILEKSFFKLLNKANLLRRELKNSEESSVRAD